MLQSGLKLSEGSDYLWYYLQKLNKTIKSGRGGQGGRKYIRGNASNSGDITPLDS